HADVGHLLANLIAGSILAVFLAQILGGGVTWLSVLASGAIGNAVNALFQPPSHTAIGASTAVFGAIGILAVLAVTYQAPLRRRDRRPVRRSVAARPRTDLSQRRPVALSEVAAVDGGRQRLAQHVVEDQRQARVVEMPVVGVVVRTPAAVVLFAARSAEHQD